MICDMTIFKLDWKNYSTFKIHKKKKTPCIFDKEIVAVELRIFLKQHELKI